MPEDKRAETNVLVLQGGGALGAYQAGAYTALTEAGHEPAWVAGISIGAINAAIICGNPPGQRVARLKAFWQGISVDPFGLSFLSALQPREQMNELSAATAMVFGVPGFYRPRLPWAGFAVGGPTWGTSIYDTSPLQDTLISVVDFDYLNKHGPRLSVGAVDVETGNFAYFDSREMEIGPEHIRASGALPPGFDSVKIGKKHYWDGGLVSNTPLQFVMENAGSEPLCVFQVDLFSARGPLPESLSDVTQRDKDIRYSSRTRLTTDRFTQLHDIRIAAKRLAERLPPEFHDDADLATLCKVGPDCPVTLVHLIHRQTAFEGAAKDYEFSSQSMTEHWSAGLSDVKKTFRHRSWREREVNKDGLVIFDLAAKPEDR
ncbi:MAG: patatin-like phospholipase family protein [bacterium]